MVRILFLVLISTGLFAQNPEGSVNVIDKKGMKQGTWVKYFPDTEVKRYEGQFKDDKPYGTFTYYYLTGDVRTVLHYREDNRVSSKSFFENGAVWATGAYIDTLRDSTWTFYSPYGNKLAVDFYILGKRYGNCKKFHSNGQLLEEKFYERELEHGPFKQYFENGNLAREAIYVWGGIEGKSTFYHPNGQVRFQGEYVKDTKHGIWKKYDENGVLIDERMYTYGVPEFRDSDLIKEDSTKYYRKDVLDIEDFIEDDYMAIPEEDKKKKKK